jgi:hypothetical protein
LITIGASSSEALAASADAEQVWVESGATTDELYENVHAGFEDERPDVTADRAAQYVLGVLAG